MAARASALAASILVVAGCAGSSPELVRDDLPNVVLQPADLSGDYDRFDEGALIRAEEPRGAAGWKARYRRRGSAEGALVVESRVDLFDDEAAAEAAFEELVSDLMSVTTAERVDEPSLGDEAVLTRVRQEHAVRPVVFFTVGWREQNALALTSVNGFSDRLDAADALELARKQQQRIERALD